MPDPRRSALEPAYRPGTFGAAGPPGVILAERRPLAMIQIAALPATAEEVRAALAGVLGVDAPTRPNTAVRNHGTTLLWVGPQRWLCVAPQLGPWKSWRLADAAITDLGHARTVMRIQGPRARDLLSKGCGLDLHPRTFPAGACAQSSLAHVAALLHALDARPTFDLYVARSVALSVWEFLADGAGEYGTRIDPPIAV
ncbi:MAG: sarcosine oxidase subunit gamma [Pseudomonadota bacterium]